MTSKELTPEGYKEWLSELKARIHQTQQKAVRSLNTELILLYWQIGHDILIRQSQQKWGTKVIDRLSQDLCVSFPELKGFSPRNLKYMRSFAKEWENIEIVQQHVAQLPWSHNIILLSKLENKQDRLWYANQVIENGWSRNVLIHQIESKLIKREGKAITNFATNLPEPQSELAQATLKDPYVFDFLSLGVEAKERDIETALTKHITQFLLELGAGFAFVGKQVHLEVGGDDYYIDLLFYHLKLRCYVVVELKTGDFKPEHTGQLSFYLSAVDSQIKNEDDAPSIGLLLCKNRNRIVAEYALRDNSKPIGVAEYQIAEVLPEGLEDKLPSIEQIEDEFRADEVNDG